MSGRGDNPFNVKLGRIFSPNGTGKFVSFAGRIRRAANASRRSSGGGGNRNSRHVAEQFFSRRVIVKVNLVKMAGGGAKGQALHLKYIERDSAALDGGKGYLFDREDLFVDGDAFTERVQSDRHQFRIVVSAQDGKDLNDLISYTRELVSQMETDLDTKLDWVAANHYDTAFPHTHIVIRGIKDDGTNLVMPREYISYGIRNRAEELVTLELGPINQMEAAVSLAKQVTQERFTQLDRDLQSLTVSNVVDLRVSPMDGSDWSWRLNIARLKHLSRMGLAEKVGKRTWMLSRSLERTLQRLGERGDILKAYHKALNAAKLDRPSVSDNIYDPFDARARPITGLVVRSGILDDVNDRAFIVLDTLEGEAIYVSTGSSVSIEDIEAGMTVSIKPADIQPKQSDITIEKIAAARNGDYSPAAHQASDPTARTEYIKAHVRRLEAMRRAGHATRNSDGSWRIPHDYLKRAVAYEKSKAQSKPVEIRIVSRVPLNELAQTLGRTWLDERLLDDEQAEYKGYGDTVKKAEVLRRQYLVSESILKNTDASLTQSHLDKLESRDLKLAAASLATELGKSFSAHSQGRKVKGIYRQSIERPSGKYAVIERAKGFSLVPWRDTLERNLGREVMGVVSGDGISWTLTKGREIS